MVKAARRKSGFGHVISKLNIMSWMLHPSIHRTECGTQGERINPLMVSDCEAIVSNHAGSWCKLRGFSLLEVVAVVVLLAIIAAIALPRLIKRRVPLRQQLIQELNHLSRTAQLNAMMTGKLHRIIFDPKKEHIQIEMEAEKRDSQGAIQFNPLKIPYVKTSAPLPKNVDIDRFLIKDKNLIKQGEGVQLTGAWFYIIPEGMAQEVTIGFRDRDTSRTFSYSINPFTAVFSLL